MKHKQKIGIYGAGGFGREVAWLLSHLPEDKSYEVIGYIDDGDGQDGSTLNGKPVMNLQRFQEQYPSALITISVGDPRTREKMAQKCLQHGFTFATLSDSSVRQSEFNTLGDGAIVCCGSILTVDIHVGQHAHINIDCTIGHDVVIGDYVTISPGVHVSGNVHIGRGAYIGTGANIINGIPGKPLVIGDYSVIGAGACVTRDTEANCLYAGVPAALRKRYA